MNGERVPRLLACGHSICHECLTKLSIRGQILLCPFDREPTRVHDSGIWGLKKNFALLELLERLQLDKKENQGLAELDLDKIRCDENEKHLASIYCTVCSTNLCEECAKETHSTKTLSRHKRVPLCEKPKGNILKCLICSRTLNVFFLLLMLQLSNLTEVGDGSSFVQNVVKAFLQGLLIFDGKMLALCSDGAPISQNVTLKTL